MWNNMNYQKWPWGYYLTDNPGIQPCNLVKFTDDFGAISSISTVFNSLVAFILLRIQIKTQGSPCYQWILCLLIIHNSPWWWLVSSKRVQVISSGQWDALSSRVPPRHHYRCDSVVSVTAGLLAYTSYLALSYTFR